MTITEKLFRDDPDMSEGDMTKARAEIVSAPSLAIAAGGIGIGDFLRLGRGEAISGHGGTDNENILADAFEAIVAAVFLDGGRDAAAELVRRLLCEAVERARRSPGGRNYKTRLQERAAALGLGLPTYESSASGPDHGPQFSTTVAVGATIGRGSGTSRKQAEQNAAKEAFLELELGVGAE